MKNKSLKTNWLSIKFHFEIMVLILFAYSQCFCQQNNPSASAFMSFEKYAVDNYTGMPQINVPLYKMPSRSKDIGIDLSLNYHASSVAVFNKEMGDCGNGWSLQKGNGVIYRTIIGRPDEIDWVNNTTSSPDIYEFRFMQYSGKFTVEKFIGTTSLQIFVTENSGTPIKIAVDYNATNYIIDSFTIYNDMGYGYEFSVADSIYYEESSSSNVIYKSAYHLSRIFDTNNITIVNYLYNKYNRIFPYHKPNEHNEFNVISGINLTGVGTVEFTGLQANNTTFYYEYEPIITIKYTGVTIKDFLQNSIRVFNFEYDISEERSYLISVTENDENESRSYYFEYKTMLTPLSYFVESFDRWGYINLTDKWCYLDGNGDRSEIAKLSSIYNMKGVLQKILLPTGGSIVYEFERNTYYHTNSKPLDLVYNLATQTTEIDEDYFYNLNVENGANNLHNYNLSNFTNKQYSPSQQGPLSFSVNGTKTYYFKFDAKPHEEVNPLLTDPDGNPIVIYNYPVFRLKKDGVLVREFTVTNSFLNIGYENHLNNGLGKDLQLTTGNYTVEMSLSNLTLGSVTVNELTQLPTVKKWWYGGGIRIKKIGYFNENVDKKYYQNGLATPVPLKEASYDYNFFNEPNKSSGYLKNSEYYGYGQQNDNYGLISYKNVTVRESNYTGKTEYQYYSPIDNLVQAEYIVDQKVGRLQETKVYNSNGNLQLSTEYEYEGNLPYKYLVSNLLIWNLPRKITEKLYQSNAVYEKSTTYEYESSLKVKKTESSTSRTNDVLTAKFFYHSLNSVHSNNRRVLERIENYKNNDLLVTSKTNYSNTWTPVAEDASASNVSYLPISQEYSKESHNFPVKEKINLYDMYGNIIEFENEVGVKTVNIWGYNKTQLVAKLENISYSQVPQNLINAIQSASNSGNEASLLTTLNNLRNDNNLTGAMITTYTYRPLIGVSTMTDVQGRKTSYEYGNFGLLKRTKDHNQNIISENSYHLKTQN